MGVYLSSRRDGRMAGRPFRDFHSRLMRSVVVALMRLQDDALTSLRQTIGCQDRTIALLEIRVAS